MAKVLILELDEVFAAVVEDRLLVAGHEATLVSEPAVAVSMATEGRADLLVMAMELPGVSGLEIVRQLRAQSETRSLPIVALSVSGESADRVEALRAGVDDFLTTPCDPEELTLRLERLIGTRGAAPPVLRGDLASHPIWELLQYVQQATKSGDLMIHGPKGSGRVQLAHGQVVEARWEKLRGEDAMLAIAGMKEGRFQLATEKTDAGAPPPAGALRIQDVLIQAASIDDQLSQYREHLPATGAALRRAAQTLPEIEEAYSLPPIEKVFARIGRQTGVRLFDLMSAGDGAPQAVRLAVAWLVARGAVATVEQSVAEPMSTGEISSSVLIDVAVHNLLSAAKGAGFDVAALPYLLLAEPGAWPQLQQLPASVPGFLGVDALRQLVETTQKGHGGSATFETDLGKLSLHVQPLAGARQLAEAIVPVCAGVLLWLHEAEEKELVQRVVRRLEAAGGAAVGILVATTPAAAAAAEELIAGTRKWRLSSHAPRSLLGVLRLLQPRQA